MKKVFVCASLLFVSPQAFCWGFFVHRLINYHALFLLPPEMMILYKKNIAFLHDHAVDPDKRRYVLAGEAPRHYIDLDHYGAPPYDQLPRKWKDAIAKYHIDTLQAHGIVPWWIQTMLQRLTRAFKESDKARIIKLSADIGHYIGDAHVPLHASSNHNGQLTGQDGIHGFWESRVPELLAERNWDFVIGTAQYIKDPAGYIWTRVIESAAESDSVLMFEQRLNAGFPAERKYAYEARGATTVKQYSTDYTMAYNTLLRDMAERRFRQAVFSVASFWYTAWVDAGRPDLRIMAANDDSIASDADLARLDSVWQAGKALGRTCD